tara:strand:- start:7 stop:549 length:543 start_codon:yes stop_codon:yes gene_type:complete
LREALARLASESFVTAIGKSGFKVSPISKKDYQQLIDLRKYLELNALRASMKLGDVHWEAQIIAAYHRMSKLVKLPDDTDAAFNERKEEMHRKYHYSLLSACGSWWELKVLDNLTNHIERYRRVLGINLASTDLAFNQVQEEHQRLMGAVLKKDFDAASLILDDHRMRTYKEIKIKLENI